MNCIILIEYSLIGEFIFVEKEKHANSNPNDDNSDINSNANITRVDVWIASHSR